MTWNDYFEFVPNPNYGKEVFPGFIDKSKQFYLPKNGMELEAMTIALGYTSEELEHIKQKDNFVPKCSESYEVIIGKN